MSSKSNKSPSPTSDRLAKFLEAVRHRLGLRRFFQSAVWTVIVAASVMLLIAMSYVVRGHAVDRQWYMVVAALGAVAALTAWFARQHSVDGAATFADRFFGLKDLLITCLHADRAGHDDGYYALQKAQATERVETISPQTIDYRPPRRQMWLAIALASVSLLLALKQPSAAVQQQLDLEATVLVETQRINAELEELVEELDQESADDEERKLVDPDALRKMVQELEKTNDYKEALRQYARLEQQLEKAREKLSQRRDEQLMARAAKELEQGSRDQAVG